MSAPRVVLPVLHVPTPCSADWHGMRGDDRARFCAACAKTVHNLSAGTAHDAARVLAEDSPCVRFRVRRDGSVFTRPSKPPRGLTRAAVVGVALIVGACAPSSPAPRDVPEAPPAAQKPPVVATPVELLHMMGGPRPVQHGAEAPVAPRPKRTRRLPRNTGKPMRASTGASAGPSPEDPLAGL